MPTRLVGLSLAVRTQHVTGLEDVPLRLRPTFLWPQGTPQAGWTAANRTRTQRARRVSAQSQISRSSPLQSINA